MDMLEVRAIATASTDAQTEVAPFIPQNQGVRDVNRELAALIPKGNAIPMNTPRKEIIATDTRIRTLVVDPRNELIACGVINPNITRAQRRRIRPIADERSEFAPATFCVR
jgi:hypothetical protein